MTKETFYGFGFDFSSTTRPHLIYYKGQTFRYCGHNFGWSKEGYGVCVELSTGLVVCHESTMKKAIEFISSNRDRIAEAVIKQENYGRRALNELLSSAKLEQAKPRNVILEAKGAIK